MGAWLPGKKEMKETVTNTIVEMTHNGITVSVKEITGLKQKYYALDVLNKDIFSSRALRTMTTTNQNGVFKVAASLVTQIYDQIPFWDLKFK